MKKLFVAAAAASLVALSGCASIQKGIETDQTIAKAEKEIAAAKKVNYLWRDTGKILKKAKKAAAAADYDKALKLAKKALKQAQLAQKQAQDQKGAGPVYF